MHGFEDLRRHTLEPGDPLKQKGGPFSHRSSPAPLIPRGTRLQVAVEDAELHPRGAAGVVGAGDVRSVVLLIVPGEVGAAAQAFQPDDRVDHPGLLGGIGAAQVHDDGLDAVRDGQRLGRDPGALLGLGEALVDVGLFNLGHVAIGPSKAKRTDAFPVGALERDLVGVLPLVLHRDAVEAVLAGVVLAKHFLPGGEDPPDLSGLLVGLVLVVQGDQHDVELGLDRARHRSHDAHPVLREPFRQLVVPVI